MKYLLLGLALAAALLGGVVFSGGEAYAGDQIRLRAFLSTLVVDPLRQNDAEFRQRPDRMRFSTEVHNVAELGPGLVTVTRDSGITPPTVILEAPITIVLDPIRGTGVGHLELDSRLGDVVPDMAEGDKVVVRNAVGELIGTGTLHHK